MRDLLSRRRFFESCGWFVAGGAATVVVPQWFASSRDASAAAPGRASPEERLRALKIELPEVSEPANTYVPTVRVGELLYVAGHGPALPLRGKVGRDLSIEQGQQAARSVGLRVLAAVRKELGTLDRVVRLVKTLGMVNAAPDFTEQPQVINGFSDFMVEIFGPKAGKGARSAVGMGSLPGNIPVEIETVFQVRG